MLHAVIVGIDRYKDDFIATLSSAAADARTLAELLESRIKPDERRVHLLVDEEATYRNIMVAVGDDLPRVVERGDIVLLYFACHGSPEKRAAKDRRSRYLIPHDAEYEHIYTTGIDMERDIARWLERLEDAKLVVFVLDACFSGAAGGRTFMGPVLAANPAVPGYLDDPQPISLKELDLGRGRVILAAADEDQVAQEDPGLGHGVFTYHLLEGLRRPREKVTTIDLTDLYAEVEVAVRRATGGAQEPVLSVIRGVRPKLPYLG